MRTPQQSNVKHEAILSELKDNAHPSSGFKSTRRAAGSWASVPFEKINALNRNIGEKGRTPVRELMSTQEGDYKDRFQRLMNFDLE